MSESHPGKLDYSAIELVLKSFGVTVANAGRTLFQQGKVGALRETDRLNTFEGEVRDEGAKYQVTLAYARSKWNLLCTCRIGTECRHDYAALLFLSKRFVKETAANQQNDAAKRDSFFRLVSDPKQLTERETDFIERLEDLYQTNQEGGLGGGIGLIIAPRAKRTRAWFGSKVLNLSLIEFRYGSKICHFG